MDHTLEQAAIKTKIPLNIIHKHLWELTAYTVQKHKVFYLTDEGIEKLKELEGIG